MKDNFIEWAKGMTKYYIWVFGLLLTHLAVLEHIITFPNNEIRMLVLLYIFDAALIIWTILDIYQKKHKTR